MNKRIQTINLTGSASATAQNSPDHYQKKGRRLISYKQGGSQLNKNRRNKIHKSVTKQKNLVKHGNIVVNLSNTPLSLCELAMLNKGLNFCITNKNVSKSLGQYNKEIARFIRTLQIKYM